jgi:FtsZ-binding cell division protein ZapB
VELRELRATVSRLRCDAQGFHDAAITAGMERDALKVEVERLKAANEHWHVRVTSLLAERDALAQDAANLRVQIDRAIDALAQDDHPFDAELYEAWKENAYGGCASCKAVFILHAALSATTEAQND